MAPAPESTAAAAGRKRKKPHGPSKTLVKKRSNPESTSGKKKKEKHKHTAYKEKKPGPTGPHAKKPAEPEAAAGDGAAGGGVLLSASMPPARQLEFFLRSFERAVKMRLSPLELDSYSEGCMVQLDEGSAQDVDSFGEHVKGAFGASWKEELCEGQVVEGEIGVGSPALLVISSAALRSLELLRGLKTFTKECRPVKLFAKHLKVEEQVAMLNARVNIACGTPSRIKKLIDMEALSLSRLKLVVFDMQKDTKSFNLFTLPQVSNEFWDLYKGYLDPKVREGNTRICFYGAVSERDITKALPPAE
ncbi:hypothetical protein SETIT_7G057000v2 [Setaria italica]|uniref:Protein CMSS1 n=1 Tax=Setaria italica TaxID=4555 RepID=K3Y8Z7_SETIT|nr:protein CMSS1 [Setaria italica]RCV33118.1 hypothetical protein SETIT_7G057000v2 [Setaria italica]